MNHKVIVQTQEAINDLLDMSPDMFKHIVALNTYTEPFPSLKQNDPTCNY